VRLVRSSLVGLVAILALTACARLQFPTKTLYETANSFVRLEVDPSVKQESGHSHPVTVTAEQVAAVLAGIVVEEPITRMPIYDDLSQPRNRRALSQAEILFFSPLLALGLGAATPEEMVTFYQTQPISSVRREVTSGGLFVRGEEMHVLLSNYRAATHYLADPGVADMTDDRLTPTKPIAPQQGKLGFEPKQFQVSAVPHGFARLFYWDRRELIVLFRRLPPYTLAPLPSPPVKGPSPKGD
jgi:hypothetical protein